MEAERLARLIPLDSLSDEALAQAAALADSRQLQTGQVLFRHGEADDRCYYLLEGEVALDCGDGSAPLVLRAGGETALYPLARLKPRRYTCVARGACHLAGFSDDALEQLVARDQATTAYEVTEFEGDDPRWMFELLASPAFVRIPAANLHTLFGRFEPCQVAAGQTVIGQGEAGDYYYLIRTGRVRVSRTTPAGTPAVLAELGPGQGFGEEALISGEPRNATVTMLDDGLLMRLPATDFNSLLREPLVRRVDSGQAAALVKRGAGLIDVRLEGEFKAGSLKGSINLPLYLLRMRAADLERKRPYVLFCQTERRSSAAAFLLAQRGFDVHVLAGGLAALPQIEKQRAEKTRPQG